MTNIQVKNVPPDVHSALRDRAASRHQSLQEYILQKLVEEARTPTDEEFFERYRADLEALDDGRPPVTGQMILDALDEGRAGC